MCWINVEVENEITTIEKKKNDIKISYPKASNQIIGSVISTKANLNYDLGQSI